MLGRGRIRNGGALGARPRCVVHRHVQAIPLVRTGRKVTIIKRLRIVVIELVEIIPVRMGKDYGKGVADNAGFNVQLPDSPAARSAGTFFAFVPVFPVRISRVLVVFPQLSIQVNAVLDRESYSEDIRQSCYGIVILGAHEELALHVALRQAEGRVVLDPTAVFNLEMPFRRIIPRLHIVVHIGIEAVLGMEIEYGVSLSLSVDEVLDPLFDPDELPVADRPGEYVKGSPDIQPLVQVYVYFINSGLKGNIIEIEIRVTLRTHKTRVHVKVEGEHPVGDVDIVLSMVSPRKSYRAEIKAPGRVQFARLYAPEGVDLPSEREAGVRHGSGVICVYVFPSVQDQEDRAVLQRVVACIHPAIAKRQGVAFAQSLAACLDQNDIVFDLDIGVFHRHLKGVYDFACYGIFQGRGHLRQHDLPCAAVGIDIGPLVQGKPLVARWKLLQGLHPLIFGDGRVVFPVGCGCLGIVVHI